MKLILEAIKALFRKVEGVVTTLSGRIGKVETESKKLSGNIREVGNLAGEALDMAAVAASKAVNAQTAANNALDAAPRLFVVDNTSNVNYVNLTGIISPENGRIYIIIPKVSMTASGSPVIMVGKVIYPIRPVGSKANIETGAISCYNMFIANNPVALLYNEPAKTFYCLNVKAGN